VRTERAKSTLIKVLGGVLPHDTYQGQLVAGWQAVRFESIRDAEAAGIAVIHQELALVDEMTVAENVFLGNEPSRLGFVHHARMYDDTQKVLEALQAGHRPHCPCAGAGHGAEAAGGDRARPGQAGSDLDPGRAHQCPERQGGARTARHHPGPEGRRREQHLHLSQAGRGVPSLDRITVLRDGESVFSVLRRETDESSIVQQMVGRPCGRSVPAASWQAGEVLLSVDRLSVAPRAGEPARLRDISFEVRGGQVLGIGGLMGAGRTEL
jgi:D-xylose transport system ATP-binding protein